MSAPKIDNGYFAANTPQQILQLEQACEVLHGQVQVLLMRRDEFARNPLIISNRSPGEPLLLAELCRSLSREDATLQDRAFARVQNRLLDVKTRLDTLRHGDRLAQYERAELAQFFVYLNLQASILQSLEACREARQALDWDELRGNRF